MHDIRAIRDDRDAFARAWRGAGWMARPSPAICWRSDKALRELLTRLQTQQARRNEASKLIGQAKQKKDEAQAKALMDEVAGLKDAIQQGEAEQRELEEALSEALAVIPNIPAADVPDGADESANVPVDGARLRQAARDRQSQTAFRDWAKRWARWISSAPPKCRARVSSISRAIWRGWSGRWALSCSTFTRGNSATPKSARRCWCVTHAMFGTGQLPKFKDDLFGAYSTEEYAKAFDEMMQEYEVAGGPPDTDLQDRIDHFLNGIGSSPPPKCR